MKTRIARGIVCLLLVLPPLLAATDPAPFIQRGKELEAQKKYPEAVAEYGKAVAAAPFNEIPYVLRGWAHHLAGAENDALVDLTTADSNKPNDPAILVRRGLVYKALKRFAQAAADFSQATALDAKSSRAPGEWALCLYLVDDYAGAVKAATVAIERATQDPGIYRLRAQAYEKLYNTPAALADVQAGRALAKTDEQKDGFAKLQARLGKPGAAPAAVATSLVDRAGMEKDAAEQAQRAAAERAEHAAAIRPDLAMPVAQQVDFAKLSGASYTAAVSSAKELMKLVLGPRSEEENSKLEALWAPAFDFPHPEIVQYLNDLNPLLAQFVSMRANAAFLLEQLNESWTEAMLATSVGNREAADSIMEQCNRYRGQLRPMQSDLGKVVKAIEALGEMPNPAALKHKARQLADAALHYVEEAEGEEILGPLRRTSSVSIELYYRGRVRISRYDEGQKAMVTEEKEVQGENIPLHYRIPIEWSDRTFFGARGRNAGNFLFEFGVYGEIAKDGRTVESLFFFRNERWGQYKKEVHAVLLTGVPYGKIEVTRTGRLEAVYWADTPQADAGTTNRPYGKPAAMLRALVSLHADPREPVDLEAAILALNRQAYMTTEERQRLAQAPIVYKDPVNIIGIESKEVLEARATVAGVTFFEGGAAPAWLEDVPQGRRPAELRAFFGSSQSWARVFRKKEDEQTAGARTDKIAQFLGDMLGLAEQQRQEKEAAAARAEQEAMQAEVGTYKRDIEAIEKHVANLRDLLATALNEPKPVQSKIDSLQWQLRTQQSEIMSKEDLITSLQTGTVVHRATPFDESCREQAILQARDDVTRLAGWDRQLRINEFLLRKLEPSQRGEIQSKLHLALQAGGDLNPAKLKEVNDLAHKRWQANLGAAKDQADAETTRWDNRVWAAETTATVADTAFSLVSGSGGYKVAGAIYSFTTAGVNNGLDRFFQTGSPQEAMKRVLYEGTKSVVTSLNDHIDYAWTAVETYYADPKKPYRDRLLDAVTAAGGKWLMNQATAYIGKALAGGADLDAEPGAWKPTGKDAIEAAKFQQQMEWDRALARDFLDTHKQYRLAVLKQSHPPAELARMAAEVRRKACSVDSSYGAKIFMKYRALPVEQRAFSGVIGEVQADMLPLFNRQMASGRDLHGTEIGKWGPFELSPIRNASSAGTASIDLDLALHQQPDWLPDGAGGLRRNVWLTRNGQPASPHEFMEEGQRVWQQLYRQQTGYSAQSSFHNITTLSHPEAYKDLAWINITKKGGVGAIDPRWAQQAGDVTRIKHFDMFNRQPALLHYQKMQESCRGTAKDIKTKVFTQLAAIEKAKASSMTLAQRQHLNEVKTFWTRCEQVMSEFGQGRLNPLEAQRQIHLLSGGRGIDDLTDRIGTAVESLGKGTKDWLGLGR